MPVIGKPGLDDESTLTKRHALVTGATLLKNVASKMSPYHGPQASGLPNQPDPKIRPQLVDRFLTVVCPSGLKARQPTFC